MLLAVSYIGKAQTRSSILPDGSYAYDFQVFFPVDQKNLSADYLSNARTLEVLDSVLTVNGTFAVDSVKMVAQSSPEGSYQINISLARERAESMRQYLSAKYPSMEGIITTEASVAPWPKTREELARLRYAAFRLVFTYDITIPQLPLDVEIDESLYPRITVADEPFTFEDTPIVVSIPDYRAKKAKYVKAPVTIAALKTNLLYDAVTALNAEIEIPIGSRLSLMVEDVFPWWEWGNKYCLEMWEMGAEARYWFSAWDPMGADKFKGFFAGAYGMSARYDFQWDTALNYQGKYWSAGLSGGWCTPIGKNKKARLELSIAAGYLYADWQHYQPTDSYNKLIRDKLNAGYVTYWGPTKAKVSLIIPLNVNVRRKEVRND
ncbi:MAG: DUF3575 domain-containing protein [Bacteroidales bacterium]|nr:DUF3575 domain-containing protein [Bacteroidales bacterium]